MLVSPWTFNGVPLSLAIGHASCQARTPRPRQRRRRRPRMTVAGRR